MVSRKQKFWTVILVIVLAIVIIGGVFGISYMKGKVTFPWQLETGKAETEEVAEPANSFNYELVCNVARRVPRVYFKNGQKTHEVNYLL